MWKSRGVIVDTPLVRRAYQENLDIALPHVERLVEQLDGRTVVTADHGNVFGDWGVYGHPRGIYLRALTTVPWLVIEDGERKEVTASETTVSTQSGDDELVERRLADLGYV